MKEKHIGFFIFILPFLMFYLTLPFITDIAPGNDFKYFMIRAQAEYMFAIKTGTFPLNVVCNDIQNNLPGGFSGIYHPITWFSAILPGYDSGNIILWNILIRLLIISLTHFIIFKFLRSVKSPVTMAFFISTVTVYSPRALFPFYTGGGFEAWTGHLLLCAAIGFECIKPSKIKGPLSIMGSTCWLVNPGHPGEMYFGILASVIFCLIIPFFLAVTLPDWNNTFPISSDHQAWASALVNNTDKNQPLKIKLAQPTIVRYIRIMAHGRGRLCLNEVEVY